MTDDLHGGLDDVVPPADWTPAALQRLFDAVRAHAKEQDALTRGESAAERKARFDRIQRESGDVYATDYPTDRDALRARWQATEAHLLAQRTGAHDELGECMVCGKPPRHPGWTLCSDIACLYVYGDMMRLCDANTPTRKGLERDA